MINKISGITDFEEFMAQYNDVKNEISQNEEPKSDVETRTKELEQLLPESETSMQLPDEEDWSLIFGTEPKEEKTTPSVETRTKELEQLLPKSETSMQLPDEEDWSLMFGTEPEEEKTTTKPVLPTVEDFKSMTQKELPNEDWISRQEYNISNEDISRILPEIELPSLEDFGMPSAFSPKEQFDLSFDEFPIEKAEDYLNKLTRNYSYMEDLVDVIQEAQTSILLESNKDKASAIGLVLHKLKEFIDNTNSKITNDRDRDFAIKAAKSLYSYFNDIFKKFPKNIRENASVYLKKIEDTRINTPQEFSSKWYNPKQIFSRNRSINIFKEEGVSVEEALQKAENEWDEIDRIVNKIVNDKNLTNDDRILLQAKFAEQIIGGASFEDAENFIRGFASAKKGNDIFKNLKFEDEDWLDKEYTSDLSDEEYADDAVLLIPKDQKENIKNKILTFGKLSNEMGMITKYAIGAGQGVTPEIMEQAQTLFEKISPIAQEILLLNPEILASDDIYKELYIVYNNMSKIAEELGLDTMSTIDVLDENITLIDVSKNIFQKTDKNKIRKRDKEVEKRARDAYISRIKDAGMYEQFLKFKAQEEMKRAKSKPEVVEKKKIRKPYYKNLKSIILKIKHLSSKKATNQNEYENNLKEANKNKALLQAYILDTYKKIQESSILSKDDIEKIERELPSNTISTIQNAITDLDNQLNKGIYINKNIFNILKQMKNEIVNYFDNAKQKYKNIKADNILYMSNSFFKFAIEY